MELSEQYNSKKQWTWEEITDKSKIVQEEENLLNTAFLFSGNEKNNTDNDFTVWNTWGLWAMFSVLSTLLLFDWLIKEKHATIRPRFTFIRFSFKSYVLQNFIWYTILFLAFDIIAVTVFHSLLNEPIDLSFICAIISFRLMVNAGSFLLALCFKNTFLYYCVSFIITLFLAITSGAILSIEGITNRYEWIELFNPLHAFLVGETGYFWLAIFILFIIIWFGRKEKLSA
jgi:ABC-2 type transport system permease protein